MNNYRKDQYYEDLLHSEHLETIERCCLCNHSETSYDKKYASYLGLREPYNCKVCLKCGLRWLSPRPKDKLYKEIYTNKYYFSGECVTEDYEEVVRKRKFKYINRIYKIKKYYSNKKKIRLLDIGAATGDFVKLAINSEIDAIGIELSEDARKRAKEKYNLDISGTKLEELNDEKTSYDVVHMNHVFEHMSDPKQTLNICNKLLNREGILILEVPYQINNFLDILRRYILFWKKPTFSPYSLHHTYFYTPENLTKLIESNGFNVISIKTADVSNTPFWYCNFKDFLLAVILLTSDLWKKGNIIEIYAKKINA